MDLADGDDGTTGAVMRRLWRLMDAQAWDQLDSVLHPSLRVRFVHTGESFDRRAYVRLNREYPGRWRAAVLDVVPAGDRAATLVRVTDGREVYYVASFGVVRDELILEMVEVWTKGEVAPPADRRPAAAQEATLDGRQ